MNAPEGTQVYVAGLPVAKGRPRVTRRGITYTPAATRKYEAHIRLAAQDAMAMGEPLDGPLHMRVNIWLPVPVSWPKKKAADALAGTVLPTKRPDADNYAKAALDGLSGIVFRDDSQVVDLDIRKRYAGTPALVINIEPIGKAKGAA